MAVRSPIQMRFAAGRQRSVARGLARLVQIGAVPSASGTAACGWLRIRAAGATGPAVSAAHDSRREQGMPHLDVPVSLLGLSMDLLYLLKQPPVGSAPRTGWSARRFPESARFTFKFFGEPLPFRQQTPSRVIAPFEIIHANRASSHQPSHEFAKLNPVNTFSTP